MAVETGASLAKSFRSSEEIASGTPLKELDLHLPFIERSVDSLVPVASGYCKSMSEMQKGWVY